MRHLVRLVAALGVAPLGWSAAQAVRTVDPGMTRAQVIERLGPPSGVRTTGEFTYLFYPNGCERRCGTSDLVTLDDDAVVDAIFRARTRRYSGTSSSPRAVSRGEASRVRPAADVPVRPRAPGRRPARMTTVTQDSAGFIRVSVPPPTRARTDSAARRPVRRPRTSADSPRAAVPDTARGAARHVGRRHGAEDQQAGRPAPA